MKMELITPPTCCVSVIIPLLAALILGFYIAIPNFFTCEWGKICSETANNNVIKEKTMLVIGILSAREHFQERQAIRETWLRDVFDGAIAENVLYKFVVGNKGCDVHTENRKDPYSCQRMNFTYTVNQKLENENFPMVSIKMKETRDGIMNRHTVIWNTSVIVRHPVVVKQLGLVKSVKLTHRPVVVQLYDDSREEIVVSAKFSLIDPGIINAGSTSETEFYRFQSVSHVLLPKDFECTLRIVMDGDVCVQELQDALSINNSGGTLELLPVDKNGFHHDFKFGNGIFIGNLIVSVHDSDQLKSIQQSQARFDLENEAKQIEIGEHLERENSAYNDMLFVNVTDVYRGLPVKLLRFHQWVSLHVDVPHVMKTDDDCFVDIPKILVEIGKFPKSAYKFWWGNFRKNWYVERLGKWAEKVYRSSEYPDFACGSGSIVSKDVSDWLAENAGVLFPYQGEDTSMGIWLSALGPKYEDDENFLCETGCGTDALVIPQLSVEEMQLYWTNKQQCNDICGCE